MESKTISFEALPQVTSELQTEVRELRETLEKFMNKVLEIKPAQGNPLLQAGRLQDAHVQTLGPYGMD